MKSIMLVCIFASTLALLALNKSAGDAQSAAKVLTCTIHLDSAEVNSLNGVVHVVVEELTAADLFTGDTVTKQSFNSVRCELVDNCHLVTYDKFRHAATVKLPALIRDQLMATPTESITLLYE